MTFRTYRAVYALAIAISVFYIFRRSKAQEFIKDNSFLLITLGWSVLAFSFIFRPAERAAIFPETLAVILLCKMILEQVSRNYIVLLCIAGLVCFAVDYSCAISNAKKMYNLNESVIQELRDNNGEICFETVPSKHRMVNPLRFDSWTLYGLAQKNNLPSVRLLPYNSCDEEYIMAVCENETLHQKEVCEYAYIHPETITDGVIYDYTNLKIPDTAYASPTLACTIQYMVKPNIQRDIREKIGLFSYDRTFNTTLYPIFHRNGNYYYAIPRIEVNHEEIITKIIIDKNLIP